MCVAVAKMATSAEAGSSCLVTLVTCSNIDEAKKLSRYDTSASLFQQQMHRLQGHRQIKARSMCKHYSSNNICVSTPGPVADNRVNHF